MKRFILLSLIFFVLNYLFADVYTAEFPVSNWSQQYPEKAWGAIFVKNVSTRVVDKKIVAVNVYKIIDITADPGYGSFGQVSQTFSVDYNKDGYADIISLTYYGLVVIKENKGKKDGELVLENTSYYQLPIENGDGTLIVDDFDNDGKLDLFAYNSWQYAQFVSDVLNSNGEDAVYKRISKDKNFVTKWTVSAMASYDYNGDGYKDVFYIDYKGRVWVWLNDPGQGSERFFDESNIIKLFKDKDLKSDGGGGVLDIGDLNNDGTIDIIVGHTDKKSIFVYFGKIVNNQLTFDTDNKLVLTTSSGKLSDYVITDPSIKNSKSPEILPSFGPTIIKITDVDRDGYKDIFIGTDAWRQGKNFGGSVYLFKGVDITPDNKPKFLSLELVHGSYSKDNNPPYDFDAGTIADLDNDGIPDFVAADGNHSGNYYKIITQTQKEYETSPGYLISDYLTNLVGILPKDLPNNFVKRIKVNIGFDLSLGNGSFEIRYIKNGIKDPSLIDPFGYPLMPDASGTIVENFTTEIEFDKPVPDPQIIIILKPESEFSAPHLKYLKYEIETAPSQVIIKGFNWNKGDN
ncbi:VCBS repeat-containing protein [Thermosipho sp. (in: thermotogales)]|jgi:hypothetical protein|uniref:FG-GAP repeat domain-containing protein n=1 Tax=Thermosipho sp. (in: thermotogales) TaxID=1968895 RepID=UPI00257F15C1|nr:VCBS repeat-containing protein [Thermosipho sp. (in: thermotogales)]MBZ4650787.1 repeat domain protein [Thermosipho sp. (in: thermotogales)]